MSAQKLTVEVDPAGLEAVARVARLACETEIAAQRQLPTDDLQLSAELSMLIDLHKAACDLLDALEVARLAQ